MVYLDYYRKNKPAQNCLKTRQRKINKFLVSKTVTYSLCLPPDFALLIRINSIIF